MWATPMLTAPSPVGAGLSGQGWALFACVGRGGGEMFEAVVRESQLGVGQSFRFLPFHSYPTHPLAGWLAGVLACCLCWQSGTPTWATFPSWLSNRKLTAVPVLTTPHPPARPPMLADLYTDMGQFEKAAEYYDKYIAKMDDSVV